MAGKTKANPTSKGQGKPRSAKPTNGLPKNWPSSLPYLTSPIYSSALTPDHLTALRTPADPFKQSETLPLIPASHPRGPSARVHILPITNPSHPAHGQHGLFAVRDLAPGELIAPYFGEVHPGTGDGAARHADSDYDLWVDRDGDIAVDAARGGNEGRFINDYRGVPEGAGTRRRANAEFRAVWDGRAGERGMGVFVLKAGVKRGEEVCVSYGKGFWGERKEGEGRDCNKVQSLVML
ncbi:hypothetical protein B0T25DRAFT_582271 [Lasiosphaeria hispida]|uniref:SET domain-containing protein n=1 Tax=Lasiosphaeria hispida TaxID=260671 RepID=A0AAJ0MC68_9PEZI|nr:hypothetical protein B0T25DRAFT_582271 [Lasiosphaeria hispida]